jgi:hypothetical protein
LPRTQGLYFTLLPQLLLSREQKDALRDRRNSEFKITKPVSRAGPGGATEGTEGRERRGVVEQQTVPLRLRARVASRVQPRATGHSHAPPTPRLRPAPSSPRPEVVRGARSGLPADVGCGGPALLLFAVSRQRSLGGDRTGLVAFGTEEAALPHTDPRPSPHRHLRCP